MLKRFISLYIPLIVTLLLCMATVEPLLIYIYKDELREDTSKDYQSAYLLLERLYPHLDSAAFQDLLTQTRKESNTPIEVKSLEEWELPTEVVKLLIEQGETWVANVEEDITYRQIAPNTIARIGPMQTIESLDNAQVWQLVILLSIFACTVLLWSLWLHVRLSKLEQASIQLSLGKLTTRAPTNYFAVGSLNNTFNTMAERLERLFASHRYLTNAVSHELRSPITRMRFQLDMLAHAKTPEKHDKHLQGIANDVDDMDALVEDMLSYSRMERTEPLMHMQTFALKPWLEEQIILLHAEVKRPIRLEIPSKLQTVNADPKLLARLLRNLVTNADRFTKTHILIGFESQKSDNAHFYKLWVDDDGPGIPIEKREKVFEPFVRLEPSRHKAYGGYGLGLAVVTQIARQHHGHVKVQNNALQGTRMLFTWPQT